MSTQKPAAATTPLQATTTDAHRHVLDALPDRGGDGATAVAWASAHLAATDKVLYAAAHAVPAAGPVLREARKADRLLQRAVFRLDRRLTGDAHLDTTPVDSVVAEVRAALDRHTRAERRVVDALGRTLDPEQREALGARLVEATAGAPTRPHPHTPHSAVSPLVSWVDAIVDRVRDLLDNRVPATGRTVRPARPLGRWASYLMAAPYPSAPEKASDKGTSGFTADEAPAPEQRL